MARNASFQLFRLTLWGDKLFETQARSQMHYCHDYVETICVSSIKTRKNIGVLTLMIQIVTEAYINHR